MKSRVITGVFIAGTYSLFLALAIYLPGVWGKIFYDLFVVALMIVGGIEMSNAVSKRFGATILPLVLINIVLGYIMFVLVNNSERFGGIGTGGVFAYFGQSFAVFLLAILYCMVNKKEISSVFSTVFVIVYPISLMVYMIALNYLELRLMALFLMFSVSSCVDMFAYFVGRAIGGPKLAPNISPKKTISGGIGGLIGGVFGAMVILLFGANGWFRIELFSNIWYENIIHMTIIGLVCGVLNQYGDLVASYIKRYCNVKDYGSFMPGHGGVLDRVDGMMLVAIFIFAYISVFQLLTVPLP